MAITIETHGDVTRLRMQSLAGRAMRVQVSAYLLDGILIDTGFARAGRELAAAVASHPVRGAIVTHSHEDHAGNVEMLAERGIPILLRSDTEAVLRQPARLRLYRRLAWGDAPPLSAPIAPLQTDAFKTVPTPGHAPDHQVVWHPHSRTLFAGDLWLGVRYAVMHNWEDPYQLIDSLRVARDLDPARMFDAHLGPVAHPVRALTAKIRWLSETLERIEAEIHGGASDREIVRRTLGGETLAAWVSFGEYAARNCVRVVRRRVTAASRPSATPSPRRSPAGTPK